MIFQVRGTSMIRKTILSLALCALPAFANSPEPSDKDIARAAQACTSDGAFGVRFGQINDAGKRADIPPFTVDQVSSRGNGVFRVIARADFSKAPMSGEDRRALAGAVLRALDAEAAKRDFARRQARDGGVTFFSSTVPNQGYALDLEHEGTTLWMVCTELSDPHTRPGRTD
jgi:hypothetical protein